MNKVSTNCGFKGQEKTVAASFEQPALYNRNGREKIIY